MELMTMGDTNSIAVEALDIAAAIVNGSRELTKGEANSLIVRLREEIAAEAMTKKVGGRTHSAGDFLVVEDPEKTTTWHLPVKVNGTPNRRLAGSAWAALFNPEGFRGEPYAGPNKAEAKRKLKALYKAEGWDEPTGESAAKEMGYYDDASPTYVPSTITSFDDLDALEQVEESTRRIYELTHNYKSLVDNIMWAQDIPNKSAALRVLFDEFIGRLDAVFDVNSQESRQDGIVEFAESAIGAVRLVEDGDLGNGNTARSPLHLEVQIIRPGWGNERDNHYYPADMLRKYSGVFEGAKMYATDHRSDEKSVRTEVSVIEQCPVRFTDDGAPIARVAVFDPDFAEATRNRARLGQLETLACSILASGKARTGEIDGREANIVEEITSAQSVDWVTRAGAGGKAVGLLTESEDGGNDMKDEEKTVVEEPTTNEEPTPNEEPAPDPEPETTPEPDVEPEPVDDVELQDEDADDEVSAEESAPVMLSEAVVNATIGETRLPTVAKAILKRCQYADEEELQEAITDVRELVKSVSKSGTPGNVTGVTKPSHSLTNEELAERQDRVNQRYGMTPTRNMKKEE